MCWNEMHLKEIEENYRDAPFFSSYENEIRRIYAKKYDRSIDFIMELIYFLKKDFDISADIVFSSKFGYKSKSTEKLLELVEAAGRDTYLSGSAGVNYLDKSLFENRGIMVEFQEFVHPVYEQRFKGFIPNMAAIDALFVIGGQYIFCCLYK